MKYSKWNVYYMTHYRPVDSNWSNKDLQKYRKWYFSWISYIENHCEILQSKARIFEIGSGVGAMATLLRDRGHDVTGSDISDMMVKCANKFCKPIKFIYCDIQKGITINNIFDIIMGFEVLEHIPNINLGVKNIYRSLRSEGYFIGSSPYPYKKNFQDPTHVNVKYPQDWEKLFLSMGFRQVQTYPMSFFPFLWRLNRRFNQIIPVNNPLPLFISTTLIVAKK